MNRKVENAKNLYLEGILEGRAREAVTKYTGDRYTQHSTGVADGIEGFVAFFEPFLERNPVRDIKIIRALQDGPFVFLQAFQDINNGETKWVTADIFDTDANDKIVEHWDIIQAYEEGTGDGPTMIDGPADVVDHERTDANKSLIDQLFDDVLIGGNTTHLSNFVAVSGYTEHSPATTHTLDGSATNVHYQKLHKMVGEGNFVATLSHTHVDGEDWAFIDLYRIDDGKIVEHWDVREPILPQDQWGNSGKF